MAEHARMQAALLFDVVEGLSQPPEGDNNMQKLVMALLAISASACAVAQTRSASLETLLATAGKPNRYSVQLLRASQACGPLADCSYITSERSYLARAIDPCVSSPLGCQLASSHTDWPSVTNLSGAKFSTELGDGMSLNVGRRWYGVVGAHATFVEGTYRLGRGSLAVDVLRIRHNEINGAGLAGVVSYRITF